MFLFELKFNVNMTYKTTHIRFAGTARRMDSLFLVFSHMMCTHVF